MSRLTSMKMMTGAILVLTGEQAFAHSQMVPFPNQIFANEVLYPASMVLTGLGVCFLVWGCLTEYRSKES